MISHLPDFHFSLHVSFLHRMEQYCYDLSSRQMKPVLDPHIGDHIVKHCKLLTP